MLNKLPLSAFAMLLCLCVVLCAQLANPNRGVNVKPASTAEAVPRRVALVIGNSTYQEAPLVNPVNDANSMEATLASLGFEVIKGLNADQRQMKELVRQFGEKMQRGGVGLFFFAGHGIQVKGINYLVPVKAAINKETEVEFEAIDAGFVLAQMEHAANQVNIIILDACRNNPFARSFRSGVRGLATIDAPKGSIIAYATAPGSTASDGAGSNGMYTGSLLKYMRTPGMSIEEVFSSTRNEVMTKTQDAQVPWESTSLRGRFSFTGGGAATTAGMSPEEALWQVTVNSLLMGDFEEFIKKYPNSPYRPAAEKRFEQLKAANRSAAAPAAERSWEMMYDNTIPFVPNEAWNETMVQAKSGQEIWIKASGRVNFGEFGPAGPDGITRADKGRPLSSCPTGALLARVGNETFCIQKETRFTPQTSGVLTLGLNAANVSAFSGSLTVKVVVQELR